MSGSSRKTKRADDIKVPKMNRLGLTAPKRIDVANAAVADELLSAQKLLYLQQDDYYKAQEHINLLTGEIDGLKEVVDKKQALINKLKKAVQDRDYTIEDKAKEVHDTHVERSAFKVLEDQNAALILKVEESAKVIEQLEKDIKSAKEEAADIREYATEKVKTSVEAEVKLQAKLQETGFALSKAIIEKDASEATQAGLRDSMRDLQAELLLVTETSKEKIYRSRQTEYRTLRRIDEISAKYQQEKDEKETLAGSVKMATLRGDQLQNRLANVLEKGEGHQLMVESIVRQVEDANDSLRMREMQLEKQNLATSAQLKVSQMAVADMLRRYKILEKSLEEANQEIFQMKQATKPRRKGEAGGEQAAPPGMGGETNNNVSKLYLEKLESLTAESVVTAFPQDKKFHGTFESTLRGGGAAPTEHLPRLLGDESEAVQEKRSLLTSYLRLLLVKSTSMKQQTRIPPTLGGVADSFVDLSRCGLTDTDAKLIVQWLRSTPLKELERIDLSHNKVSARSVDALSAFVCAIPGSDLVRAEPLLFDLRGNHLSSSDVERLGLQIRKTPRREVKLVSFEEANSIISLYGTNKCVVRIDCRGCSGLPVKASLREKLSLGSNVSDRLSHAFPGDVPVTGQIYPRDEVMKYKPLE
jgi:hypothetical protein